ncbi:unnamed protein product [Urochloa decumbens]|uniref:DUF1618 domain-containing protein n=1 Tax=Urochloa decumbens TaxID=240449 RepID=A0ABC9GDW4_9POAL
MPAAAQEPWAILAAIPEVAMDKEAAKRAFPPGVDASIAFDEPPRPSVLTVTPEISLPACLGCYPYVAAADRSGLLLLCGSHPMGTDCLKISHHVCDAVTGEVVTLPYPPRNMAFYGANIGLIVKGDAGCMVAALQSARRDGVDTGAAVLLSYKVGDDRRVWRERGINAGVSPAIPRGWFPEGVVSHGGMLWWVDLSNGLLACDPFADEPELLHVPLPTVADELPADSQVNSGARSCVKVSRGRLRYVRIHGGLDAPVVSMWMLVVSTWGPAGRWEWIPESSVPFAAVWMDESYVNTKLPSSIPAIALIHPMDPDRVFFFLGSSIFAVDLQLRKVVGFSKFEMLDPPKSTGRMRSSRFVHAWHYDPSSTRPEFVSACLNQEKVIAAMGSYSGIYRSRRRTYNKMVKSFWDLVTKQEQEMEQQRLQLEQQWRQRAMCRDFERRCGISEEIRISLPHLSGRNQNQPSSSK